MVFTSGIFEITISLVVEHLVRCKIHSGVKELKIDKNILKYQYQCGELLFNRLYNRLYHYHYRKSRQQPSKSTKYQSFNQSDNV